MAGALTLIAIGAGTGFVIAIAIIAALAVCLGRAYASMARVHLNGPGYLRKGSK